MRNFLSLMVSLGLPTRRDLEIGCWSGQRAFCNFSSKTLRKEVFRVLVTPLSLKGSGLYHKLWFWRYKIWTGISSTKKKANKKTSNKQKTPYHGCCRKTSITSTPEVYCKTFLVELIAEIGQHFGYWFNILLS